MSSLAAVWFEVQVSTDRIGNFYSNDQPRFHLPLNYALLEAPWTAVGLGAAIDECLNAIPDGAWPDWVLGGHVDRSSSQLAWTFRRSKSHLLSHSVQTRALS